MVASGAGSGNELAILVPFFKMCFEIIECFVGRGFVSPFMTSLGKKAGVVDQVVA
jgi:hypothetical protein